MKSFLLLLFFPLLLMAEAVQTTQELRAYQSVASLSTVNSDYTVPNGATIFLQEMGGNAPTANSFSNMQIIWDPAGTNQMLFGTYSSGFQHSSLSFVGNGTKVLRLSLVNNDPLSARIVGGYVIFTLSQ